MEMNSWIITLPADAERAAHYDLHLGADFFQAAGHADLLGGDISAEVDLSAGGGHRRITLHCSGTVETLCDRCQQPMTVAVDDSYSAPMKESEGGHIPAGDDTDAVYYDGATGHADLLRPLADTIALSLGLCHYHADGECDPEVEKALYQGEHIANTPFAAALGGIALPEEEENAGNDSGLPPGEDIKR